MPDAIDLARRFVIQHHSDAEAAVLTGSQGRREGTDGSDYDVVLLFRSLPDGAWRTTFEGQHVEVFAHDVKHLPSSAGTSTARPACLLFPP